MGAAADGSAAGQLQAALVSYKAALQLTPDESRLYSNLAVGHLRRGEVNKVGGMLTKIADHSPPVCGLQACLFLWGLAVVW